MLSINTNLGAWTARQSLNNSTNILNQAIERMSTGLKINGAKDNAANYAITEQMTTQLSALDIAEDNTAQGLDLVTTASETLDLINSRFTRLRDLAVQAENKTYGEESLKAINMECQALVEEIKRIYHEAEFNGLKIYGAEFLETIPTDGTSPIQTFSIDPTPIATTNYATETTTLQELGIEFSSFQIYNSAGGLIESYDTEKSDTLADIFNVLSTYGFNSSITDGVVSISSTNGRYVNGDLMRSLGIDLDGTEFVSSSQQGAGQSVYYTTTMTATEASTLADLGVLTSGSDSIIVKDKYGDNLGSFAVNSATTLGGLFNSLGNYDIQGEIDDGVITLSSSDGNYVLSQGVIANLGIGTVESSNAVTTGTSQTSAGVVTYEEVVETPGVVTTVTEERTTTIWTTTTTSETHTETVWTTTTTPEERTVTIWTTTTTSETQTETITVTQTVAITDTITFAELGLESDITGEVRNSSNTTKVIGTIAISPTDSIGEFRSVLATYSISTELTDGKFYFDGLNSTSNYYYYLSGDIVEFLGIGPQSVSVQQASTSAILTSEITFESNTTVIGTNTVTPGDFKEDIEHKTYTNMVSISSLANGSTLTTGATYAISTTDDLVKLASMTIKGSYSNTALVLTNDIDMSGINWTKGIRLLGAGGVLYHRLTFNGNGYKITNLTGSCGLFNEVDWAEVENLGLVDVNITSTSSVVGGLVNELVGNITNCFVTGTVSTSGDYSTIGGLVAISDYESTITQSYTSVSMTIEDASEVGGLIGYVGYGTTITDCYVEGSINYSNNLYYNPIRIGGVVGEIAPDSTSAKCNLTSVLSACTILINKDNNKEGGIGGIIGKYGDYDTELLINNVSFTGNITNNSSNKNVSSIFGILEVKKDASVELYDIYNGSTLSNTFSKTTILCNDDTLTDFGVTSGNIGIKYSDGTKRTIAIDATKTILQTRKDLEQYGIQIELSSGNLNFYLNRVGATYCSVSNASNITSFSKKKVSRTLRNGPCNAYIENETETVNVETTYTTNVSSDTLTETIYITTTSSTTKVETTTVTTTTLTTETETVEVTQTSAPSYTTTNISMTADTTFSDLGLSSRSYVTVMNEGTRQVITIKVADTVLDLVTKLNTAGILTELEDGKLSISSRSKGIYISGMSDALKDALIFDSDFYSTSLGVDMTDSNMYIYDGEVTVNQATTLSEIGVTSGELVVKKDGQAYSTIAVSNTQTLESLTQQLSAVGFSVRLTNGAIQLKATGDMYVEDGSTNAVSVFGLTNVSQETDTTYANTDSNQLEKLSEIVNRIWQASSAINLQVGINSDEKSKIEVSTGFTLYNLDSFANIGKNMVNNKDYIAELDEVLALISAKQVELGAYSNRLESVLDEITIKYDNLVSSRSTLRDADIADESSIYIQQQILQQASATLLSVVAHQTPQLALQLL